MESGQKKKVVILNVDMLKLEVHVSLCHDLVNRKAKKVSLLLEDFHSHGFKGVKHPFNPTWFADTYRQGGRVPGFVWVIPRCTSHPGVLFFFIILAEPCGLQRLSSLTKD